MMTTSTNSAAINFFLYFHKYFLDNIDNFPKIIRQLHQQFPGFGLATTGKTMPLLFILKIKKMAGGGLG